MVNSSLILSGILGLTLLLSFLYLLSLYKRCPANKILVIYGGVGEGKNARSIHGGGAFKVTISTNETSMPNAAKYLLDLREKEVKEQAHDIIIGQLRLVIANLTIEEMQQELESFVNLIHKYLENELNTIGLELINVSIQSIREKLD